MAARKQKLLTAKISDDLEEAIIDRCNSLGCNKSDYIKALIQSDLDDKKGGPAPAVEQPDSQYIVHRGNPDIKLVKQIYENNRTSYMDTNGKKWFMKIDKTLVPIATVQVNGRDDSQREVKKPDGSTDVYKNGRLEYTAIPPRHAGANWTYVLH